MCKAPPHEPNDMSPSRRTPPLTAAWLPTAAWLLTAVCLVGCAPAVTDLGNGQFLTRKTRRVEHDVSAAKAEALAEATEYCNESGRSVAVRDEATSRETSTLDTQESVTLTFVCQ